MKRLQFNCTQSELLPLMELDNVRQPRAQQLYNAGYTTLEIIAKADAKELVEKIKNLPLKAATSLIKSANVSGFFLTNYFIRLVKYVTVFQKTIYIMNFFEL